MKTWDSIVASFGTTAQRDKPIVDQMGDFLSKCNHRNEDDLTVAKLCFPAFTWHIWRERDNQIFRNKARLWEAVLHDTKAQIRSRANCLNREVSSHIAAAWDLSTYSNHTLTKPIPFSPSNWNLLLSS